MKRMTVLCMFLTLITVLTGCGETIPELDEEQEALVTEYATGLLIKYNSLPDNCLLNTAQLEQEEKKEQEERDKEAKRREAEEAYLKQIEEKEAEKKDREALKSGKTEPKEDPAIDNLATFFGMNDFSVEYTGYSLCQSYPDETRDDYFLAMDATPGNQLCILQFNVTNVSGGDADFDMFGQKSNFYLSLNGQDKIPMQSTLLLDDLAAYKGVVTAGQTTPMVLVFEIGADVTYPGTMELTAKNSSTKGILPLQ